MMSQKSALTHGISAVAQAVQMQCGPQVSDAAGAEATARDKWSRAGKALAKAGVTSQMLVKATEKQPNDAYDPSLYETVRSFIIQGVSVAKKNLTFTTTVPGSVCEENPKGSNRWTVALLLGLDRDQLREIDDDILKSVRRDYMQMIDGPMISRIRMYVDKANGVEKPRENKKEKAESESETVDPIVILQGWTANAVKMVDVSDVQRFQDAAFEMIACLRRIRKS
jgi:hypothetical protein